MKAMLDIGYSRTAVARRLNVDRRTVYRWSKYELNQRGGLEGHVAIGVSRTSRSFVNDLKGIQKLFYLST